MSIYDNIMMASSGDPEQDSKDIERYIKSDRLISEGLCPNGCGPMNDLPDGGLGCPVCPFEYHKATLRV